MTTAAAASGARLARRSGCMRTRDLVGAPRAGARACWCTLVQPASLAWVPRGCPCMTLDGPQSPPHPTLTSTLTATLRTWPGLPPAYLPQPVREGRRAPPASEKLPWFARPACPRCPGAQAFTMTGGTAAPCPPRPSHGGRAPRPAVARRRARPPPPLRRRAAPPTGRLRAADGAWRGAAVVAADAAGRVTWTPTLTAKMTRWTRRTRAWRRLNWRRLTRMRTSGSASCAPRSSAT